MTNARDYFLAKLDREFDTTMRVLRSLPDGQAEFRPVSNAKTARDLAWTFALERGLALKIWSDHFARQAPSGTPAEAPARWEDLLSAIEEAHRGYREVIARATDEDLEKQVSFFTAPKMMGQMSRLEWLWFMLFDEVHHRGQFSVYVRLAGGRVPSIYGPSEAEPWI